VIKPGFEADALGCSGVFHYCLPQGRGRGARPNDERGGVEKGGKLLPSTLALTFYLY
jgi:hypothetical protein